MTAPTTQLNLRIGSLAIAILICALMTVLMPSLAFASDDGSCQDPQQALASEPEMAKNSAKNMSLGQISSQELLITPCERARQEGAQSYNLCYEANPNPSTAVPEWVAKRQAEEAVVAIFDQVIAIHTEKTARAPSRPEALGNLPGRAWLASAIKVLEEQAPVDGGSICLESDESCQNAPMPGHIHQLSTTMPAKEGPGEYEWPVITLELGSQPPLIELRVGPAQGFEFPQERPPQV